MSEEFLDPGGVAVPPGSLTLPRAAALARLAGGDSLPYVRLLECRRSTRADGRASETVVVEVDVERPQVMVHEMRRTERVAAVFDEGDGRYPEVLALRASFPQAPHQNVGLVELPRSLCLYDRPWAEVAIRWTAAAFVERIRHWMAQTARGRLHQDGQPLEQFLLDSGYRIILPAGVMDDLGADSPARLDVLLSSDRPDCRTLFAVRPAEGAKEQPGLKCVATSFAARPQTHGIIRRTPENLSDLHDLLAAGGIDLIGSLRQRFLDWGLPVINRKVGLVVIAAFPLTRADGAEPERWDFWAFMTFRTLRQVGVAIGAWAEVGGQLARQMEFDETDRGKTIPVHVLSPYHEFSRAAAAVANGEETDARAVVTVGAGALGSQVIDTLARSGFGAWTVVDEDDLMPHNLARHTLHKYWVGNAKAVGMEAHLNALYSGAASKAIVADVLAPKGQAEALTAAFATADVVLDVSASVPVARHLALDVKSPARRVSVFLNPTGTDVVVLAEPAGRAATIDAVEAQYYRAAASDPRLAGHLGASPGRLRYGRSCRDVTTTMPTYLVAMHAAIAAEGVRKALAADDASIRVWRCDTASIGVTPVEVETAGMETAHTGGWTLAIDRRLLTHLSELRATKLPNETGGVLIGVYDLSRRTVYAVDTVPSPPDSEEWPTLYIRGSEGLLARVTEITRATGGQLEYVGEWHSHPDGFSTLPSEDDVKVFGWLTQRLADDGLPALMAIIGENDGSSWFLDVMEAGAASDVNYGGEESDGNGWSTRRDRRLGGDATGF